MRKWYLGQHVGLYISIFDEIMTNGWNGIYVRKVDAKTTNVFYRGSYIGTYTVKVCSHHIAESLVDNMCLA